jgi:hypothetical protein
MSLPARRQYIEEMSEDLGVACSAYPSSSLLLFLPKYVFFAFFSLEYTLFDILPFGLTYLHSQVAESTPCILPLLYVTQLHIWCKIFRAPLCQI